MYLVPDVPLITIGVVNVIIATTTITVEQDIAHLINLNHRINLILALKNLLKVADKNIPVLMVKIVRVHQVYLAKVKQRKVVPIDSGQKARTKVHLPASLKVLMPANQVALKMLVSETVEQPRLGDLDAVNSSPI